MNGEEAAPLIIQHLNDLASMYGVGKLADALGVDRTFFHRQLRDGELVDLRKLLRALDVMDIDPRVFFRGALEFRLIEGPLPELPPEPISAEEQAVLDLAEEAIEKARSR